MGLVPHIQGLGPNRLNISGWNPALAQLAPAGLFERPHGADFHEAAGAGQDADVFDFTTDVDNTQRAEIKIMQGMLEKMANEEKR